MNVRQVSIDQLMSSTGVRFGTSGARGPVVAMTDAVCYAYTAAFIQYLERRGELAAGGALAIGRDLRPSSKRIAQAVAAAIADRGHEIVNAGELPTPALALYGLAEGIPSLMVTGSHVPDDRNGIKFYKAHGEILKEDERGIAGQHVPVLVGRFEESSGTLRRHLRLPAVSTVPLQRYVDRYVRFFSSPRCLEGQRVGLYEHSSVAREALHDILEALGVQVVRLGRSHDFVPVDTEAIRCEDVELAKDWAAGERLMSIVSTDGDGDRPLVSDEKGNWLRGDVVGLLTARYLRAEAVATPVSSNTGLERLGRFREIVRTRIGSPYVIEGMKALSERGHTPVVGYEANGGVLLGTDLADDDVSLSALPTRDASLPILCVLASAARADEPVSRMVDALPPRYTHSDRLKDFPVALGRELLDALGITGDTPNEGAVTDLFSAVPARLDTADTTDGLRMTFRNEEVVHLRPSGNAPEFRCYTEAASPGRAASLNASCMRDIQAWRRRRAD